MKKILGCLLLGMLVLLSTEKVAAAELPDFNKKCSINVYMRDSEGKLITGGSLEAYKVAYVYTSNLGNKYMYTSEFAGVGYSLDEEEIASLAADLYKYASDNGIQGVVYENVTGVVTMDNLTSGLYLIDNKQAPPGYNGISPFLVSAPLELEGIWIYDVDASPKMSLFNQKIPTPELNPNPEAVAGGNSASRLEGKPLTEAEKNIVKDIESPATGDESGYILAIIICSAIICIASAGILVYLIRKRKHEIHLTP